MAGHQIRPASRDFVAHLAHDRRLKISSYQRAEQRGACRTAPDFVADRDLPVRFDVKGDERDVGDRPGMLECRPDQPGHEGSADYGDDGDDLPVLAWFAAVTLV